MKKILIAIAFASCIPTLALANGNSPPAEQQEPPQEMAQPVPLPQTAPRAECPQAAPRQHVRKRVNCKPRTVHTVARQPASVQTLQPIVQIQPVIVRTVLQQEFVSLPPRVRQAPPTIVRNPCQTCQPRMMANPCGPRPCVPGAQSGYPDQRQVAAAPAPQLPSRTDDGLNIHQPNTAPDGSRPCTRVVNGQQMTGKCW